MNIFDKSEKTLNHYSLGHRIQPNWTLWIILFWMTLIAFGSMIQDVDVCVPTYEFGDIK